MNGQAELLATAVSMSYLIFIARLVRPALGFVPAALLDRAMRPTGSTLECVALAPTLSFAFVFLFGELATITGVPFAPAPFLVVVSAAAALAGWRRRARKAEAAQT